VISLWVTGNILRRLHSFRPLVDIPQMCLSWVTFAEGCTVFHLSTSESVLISNGDAWMGTQLRHLARGGTLLTRPITNMNKRHSPGGATIGHVCLGSPICSGIIIHCTFSSTVVKATVVTGNKRMVVHLLILLVVVRIYCLLVSF